MARRSLFVALAALAAALAPAGAQAATPTVTSANFATPVTLSWTPDAVTTQTLFRAPGTCSTPPMAGQTDISTSTAIPGFANSFSDAPGEGASVTTSRTTPCVRQHGPGDGRHGASARTDRRRRTSAARRTSCAAPSTITATSTDAVSGVVVERAHVGGVGTCAAGPRIARRGTRSASPTAPTTSATSSTDNASHTATATGTVVVDNTVPTGAVVTLRGGNRRDRADRRALDRRGRRHGRHPKRPVALGGRQRWRLHNIGAAVAVATRGWARSGTPRPSRCEPAPARWRHHGLGTRHRQRRQRADDHDARGRRQHRARRQGRSSRLRRPSRAARR